MAISPFSHRLDELVQFVWVNMVVQASAWGGHDAAGRRRTLPPRRYRGEIRLVTDIIRKHFAQGDISGNSMGLHTTGPDGLCKVGSIDIDAHGTNSPEATWRAALGWCAKLKEAGISCLLEDSDGRGSYHIWIILASPLPSIQLRSFLKHVVSDWQRHGMNQSPEVFPKQMQITAQVPYGSWIRLPGFHPVAKHWSRFWNGTKWLEGKEAVCHFLDTPLADPAKIPHVESVDDQGSSKAKKKAASGVPRNLRSRIAAYVKKLGAAGQGERNEKAYVLACFLARDLALEPTAVRDQMARWNLGNKPPLEQDELDQILENACAYGRRDVGSGLEEVSDSQAVYERLLSRVKGKCDGQECQPAEPLRDSPSTELLLPVPVTQQKTSVPTPPVTCPSVPPPVPAPPGQSGGCTPSAPRPSVPPPVQAPPGQSGGCAPSAPRPSVPPPVPAAPTQPGGCAPSTPSPGVPATAGSGTGTVPPASPPQPPQDPDTPDNDPFGDLKFKQFKKGSKDSFDILVNFLWSLNPVHRTSTGKIYFEKGNIELSPTQCYGLPGAMVLMQKLPEYEDQADKKGDVKPTAAIALAEKLFGGAGRRLMARLPDGTLDTCQDTEVLRAALVGFLVRPRLLGKTNTAQRTYTAWALTVNPVSKSWAQCFEHPVYAMYNNGIVRVAAVPAFLWQACPILFRRYQSPDEAGKSLLRFNLIDRQNDGRGTHQIRCAGRRPRVWILADSIVEAACGSPDDGEGTA